MTLSYLTYTLTENPTIAPDVQTYSLTGLPEDTFLYHLLLDDVYYSIERVHDLPSKAGGHAVGLTTDSQTAIVVEIEYSSTSTPYAVYSRQNSTSFGEATLSDISSSNTRHIINHYQHIFNGVMSESDSDWHKPIQLQKAAETIDQVQWKQDVEAVAADLLSSLLQTHALPNANHRTALGLLSLYISVTDSSDNLFLWIPRLFNHEPTIAEVLDKFILESKRLLTVRRNAPLFNFFYQEGFRSIVRKNDVLIDLSQYQLDVDDPYDHFGRRHRNHCRSLVNELLESNGSETHTLPTTAIPQGTYRSVPAGDAESITIPSTDPGKRVFVDRLASIDTQKAYTTGVELAALRD